MQWWPRLIACCCCPAALNACAGAEWPHGGSHRADGGGGEAHNLSAILRTCDACGVFEAHAVGLKGRPRTFNSTAQGSQSVPIAITIR